MEGISVRALLWRCFSSCVILLYLFDERTSLLVSVPAAFGLVIELWKLRKALKFRVLSFFPPRVQFGERSRREAETEVRSCDSELCSSFNLLGLYSCFTLYEYLYSY